MTTNSTNSTRSDRTEKSTSPRLIVLKIMEFLDKHSEGAGPVLK